MQDASIGIYQSLVGMLEQWSVSNVFSYDYGSQPGKMAAGKSSSKSSASGTPSSPQARDHSSSSSPGQPGSAAESAPAPADATRSKPQQGSKQQQQQKQQQRQQHTRPPGSSSTDKPGQQHNGQPAGSKGSRSSSSSGSGRPAKPDADAARHIWQAGGSNAQPVQQLPPAAMAPPAAAAAPVAPPAGSYIVPRPATPAEAAAAAAVATAAVGASQASSAAGPADALLLDAALVAAAAAAASPAETPAAAAAAAAQQLPPAPVPDEPVDEETEEALSAAAMRSEWASSRRRRRSSSSSSNSDGQEQPSHPPQRQLPQARSSSSSGDGQQASTPQQPPQRQLLQARSSTTSSSSGGSDPALAQRRVCNKGTPTASSPSPFVKRGMNHAYGTLGVDLQQSNVVPPDPALAVGPQQALHVVNSLVRIIPLTTQGNIDMSPRRGASRTIPLPDFFALVASPCDGGYIYPHAVYDKEIGRFLLTCVCGGDSNQVLLAVSTTSSAHGTWILYSFPGEVTKGLRMQCPYPVSLYSKVGYNRDGVFLSWVQNCPDNQETATGAIIAALPKWAVYRGATFFYAPVWTAYDILDGINSDSDQYYPGAFLQAQPVVPQRAEDVQNDVTYFVIDNLNWVWPLQRQEFTLIALINTGSLWLYEGPRSQSPGPLLVARLISRGIASMALPDNFLVQPLQLDSSSPPQLLPPSFQCGKLDAGAMRPPGFWDGGAALYANQIYLADRGPDITSQQIIYDTMQFDMTTVYWAIITPSFCVNGPCAPWFGADWGWSDGWDWATGTWVSTSKRAQNPYSDPAFYNQVFLFPPGVTTAGPIPQRPNLRRLQQQAAGNAQPVTSPGSSSSSSSSGASRHLQQASSSSSSSRDAVGVPIPPEVQAVLDLNGTIPADEFRSRLGNVIIGAAMAIGAATMPAAAVSDVAGEWDLGLGLGPALAAPEVSDALSSLSNSSSSSSNRTVSLAASGAAANAQRAGSSSSSSSNAAATASPPGTVSASFFIGSGWGGGIDPWNGWACGGSCGAGWGGYYKWWKEHYFLRNLYMNLRIPPKTNPCKYYKDWNADNRVTFGAIVSRRGVLDYITNQQNPVGLAHPQVAVVGGLMLVVYSFSGPLGLPGVMDQSIRAYPGIAYSVIPPDGSNGNFPINYAKVPGNETNPGCIKQIGVPFWGSYSGIDVHHPSLKVISAVETAWGVNRTGDLNSNAATWLSVFV
uniref:Uncharacterized protein n=1 Tax=Tetradesmus obliquus TaxID=3088 RepID=A0A383V3P6_TETOB|eukprot:jgi/Sobl393_1/14353/SZX60218.1